MVSKTHPNEDIFSTEEIQQAYRQMLTIRRFEEKAGQAYTEGLIAGFCHLYIGQEAVAVGIKSTLQPGDQIITGYRCHGHHIVSGEKLTPIMAELFGKSIGVSKGKGGSMHLFNPQGDFYGGHGIVGAQSSLGTGMAFANKYLNNDNISAIFFGDGALNQGQLYESFNMARLWNLPALYIIENNKYAMGTSIERGCANSENLFYRGEGFMIPGEAIDGMNIFDIKRATITAVDYVRKNGPALLEMQTYRYKGHSMSDPAKYRTREEVDEYRKEHDPLLIVEDYCKQHDLIPAEWFIAIDQEIKNEVGQAYQEAKDAPEPDLSLLYTDVLC